ncbi:hypothetical protein [Deinococcus cellulosilyticus]|uniref:hypothetical protein n=1 Tax=Deinococcus cellulosilyticus TaxID=401558 RepID=UPI0011BD5286|nr:hypothetical protein [Deinococcus cellulosilyticus]
MGKTLETVPGGNKNSTSERGCLPPTATWILTVLAATRRHPCPHRINVAPDRLTPKAFEAVQDPQQDNGARFADKGLFLFGLASRMFETAMRLLLDVGFDCFHDI